MTTPTAAAKAAGLSDRRHFLTTVAAAPAAIAAATIPTLTGAGTADGELLALREPFDRTWRAYAEALDADEDGDNPLVVATSGANREIVDEMCRLPARTIEGPAFKARVSLEHEDNLYEELVTSIMDDIIAMGGAHA